MLPVFYGATSHFKVVKEFFLVHVEAVDEVEI